MGPQGCPGIQGNPGINGTNGINGSTGPTGPTGPSGLSSLFAKAVFVDATYGNDGTAVKYSLTNKFQTIATALAAAIPGDLIYVFPGTYSEGINFYKDGITYYLSPGVLLAGGFSASSGTCTVYGKGNIGSGFGPNVIDISGTATFYMEAADIIVGAIFAGMAIRIRDNAVVDILCENIMGSGVALTNQPAILHFGTTSGHRSNITVTGEITTNASASPIQVVAGYDGTAVVTVARVKTTTTGIFIVNAGTANGSYTLNCPNMVDTAAPVGLVPLASLIVDVIASTLFNITINGNLRTVKNGFLSSRTPVNCFVKYVGDVNSDAVVVTIAELIGSITRGNYEFIGNFYGNKLGFSPPPPSAAVYMGNLSGASDYWLTFDGYLEAKAINQDGITLPNTAGPVLRIKDLQLKVTNPGNFSVSSPSVIQTYKVVGVFTSNAPTDGNITNEYLGATVDFVDPGIVR